MSNAYLARSCERESPVKRLLQAEPVRFLLVGAVNTALGFALFTALWLSIGNRIGYLACLYLSYAGAIIVAYLLYRRFVFRSADRGALPFLRFSSVYVVSLAINTVALPALVIGFELQPLIAQAAAVVVTTACSYLGHRFFTFRAQKTK
ncbi:GtrA family protein [Subtercola boreus]|nr:GtrA family protein [Subtercola boreus]TQL52749.1 putative flippase GtrA [Subtercola boreus]